LPKKPILSTILIPFYHSTAVIGKCRRYPPDRHAAEAQKKLFQSYFNPIKNKPDVISLAKQALPFPNRNVKKYYPQYYCEYMGYYSDLHGVVMTF